MASQKIQNLKTLPKLNRSNDNFDDVLIKSIKQESMDLLESPLRNSPRVRRNDITTISRRRRKHPKLKTVSRHQWSHHDSVRANPLLGLSNKDTSEQSENDSSTSRSNASSDEVLYNLIEYQGDDSTSAESEFHIKNMSNSDMAKANQHSMLGGSSETKFVNVKELYAKLENRNGVLSNVIGLTAKKTPRKIVFLIPAELAASVEIMKVQSSSSVASVKTPLETDQLFSGINQLPTITTLLPSTSDPEVSDFLGPIKRQIKKSKNKRNNAPYARRIVQNYGKENRQATAKQSSNARDFALLDNIKLEIPESYVSRDYQQTRDFAGPIRSKNYRNGTHKQTTISSQNVTATTIDRQCPRYPVDAPLRGKNDRNKPYYNSKFRKVRLCWNCQSDSHLLRQCPLA